VLDAAEDLTKGCIETSDARVIAQLGSTVARLSASGNLDAPLRGAA
jgi:hypothetical protein